MFARNVLAMSTLAVVAFGADQIAGTWKLNTTKSKYVGMPMPKDATVTYTTQGTGWRYEAKGTTGEGKPLDANFVYVKDDEDIKLTGFPHADAIVLKNGKADVSTATFKREGKAVGNAKRTISKDGKTMTITGNVTMPDGKKGTYTAVYEKQ